MKDKRIFSFYPGKTIDPIKGKRIIKQYSWYNWDKAIKESGRSLAELFDFKTGTLIHKKKQLDKTI